tara:strand:- start:74 stop:286 length:213 start_codon:yes stop_codon:yes gene_type:complete
MSDIDKFYKALCSLKSDVECVWNDTIDTEEKFKKIKWKTGQDSKGQMISSTDCPHSEITWTKIKEEMDKL